MKARVLCAVIALSCGGGGSTTAPANNPPVVPPVRISFGAVAGRWSGTVTEIRQPAIYVATITLQDSATLTQVAGSVAYKDTPASQFRLDCGGELRVTTANAGSYSFTERITSGTGCGPGGRVDLSANPDGTLTFSGYNAADVLGSSGTLRR